MIELKTHKPASNHLGGRVWYSRRTSRPSGLRTREYHVLAFHRVVSARRGSYWKLVFFHWCLCFGYRPNHQLRAIGDILTSVGKGEYSVSVSAHNVQTVGDREERKLYNLQMTVRSQEVIQ